MSCYSARWAFDLWSWKPGREELAQALSCIQTEERTRIEMFAFRRDGLASLAGRLLSRAFCSKATEIPCHEITLARDENNKPYLKDNEDVKFNVSHQGRYAVLAGETSVNSLGIDIMNNVYDRRRSLQDFFRLMEKNFATSEWKQIMSSMNESDQAFNFFRLWTLKESYVKATGTGITVPLADIQFLTKTNPTNEEFITDTELYINSSRQNGWIFQEMKLDQDHCVSVAYYGPLSFPSSRRFESVNMSNLLSICRPLSSLNLEAAYRFLSKPYSPQSLNNPMNTLTLNS